MTAVAIKINPAFAELARSASTDADRSLTGQVEHWARLGRAVEPMFSAPDIAALKKCGGDLGLLDDEVEKARVLAVLENFRKNPASFQMKEFIGVGRKVFFEPDPDNPDGMIRIQPDGSRERGTMAGRTFVPST